METMFAKNSPTHHSKHLKRKSLRQNYLTPTCIILENGQTFFKVCLAICHHHV